MDKYKFMRDIDINIIDENIDKLMEESNLEKKKKVKPTLEEFNKYQDILLKFIKNKKRIIYGGYAWNEIIKLKDKSKCFYNNSDFNDIEFYSPEPIKDLKELCDIYHKEHKIEHVSGINAAHHETYSIFVEFVNMCDITYIDKNIFQNMPIIEINGIKYVSSIFILIDILRMITDPIISYWRFNKFFPRAKIIFDLYKLKLVTKLENKFLINKADNNLEKLMVNLLTKLKDYPTLIFLGEIALKIYLNPNSKIKYENEIIEVISFKLKNDIKKIKKLLRSLFNNYKLKRYKYLEFYPFFQFLDNKYIFYYNNKKFLTIIGSNGLCNPYNNYKIIVDNKDLEIRIGTFNLLFKYMLIYFIYLIVNKKDNRYYSYIMYKMLKTRDEYFEKNKLNILDKSLFQDFKIECLGKTELEIRKYKLSISKRDKALIHPYDPSKKENLNPDNYIFKNTSGEIKKNNK